MDMSRMYLKQARESLLLTCESGMYRGESDTRGPGLDAMNSHVRAFWKRFIQFHGCCRCYLVVGPQKRSQLSYGGIGVMMINALTTDFALSSVPGRKGAVSNKDYGREL